MRHATDTALDALEPLLQQLRTIDGLIEKRRGVFYRRSQAFLHFHEDPTGFFADVRLGPEWQRLPAGRAREQRELIDVVRRELGARKALRPSSSAAQGRHGGTGSACERIGK